MIILDIREKEEFQAEYIPGSISCPLSEVDLLAPGILKNIKDGDVVVMCRSGKRAKMALPELQRLDSNRHTFSCYEGGLTKWKDEGKVVRELQRSVIPIMRQMQIVASSMIFLAFLGHKFVAYEFIYLVLLVGIGLAISGFIGICPVVSLLQKMPWNKKTLTHSTNTQHSGRCCG